MEDANAHDSWRQWFELHSPKLLLYARQWTRSLADAEDVLQEGFVRFWRHQRQLGGEPLPLVLTSIRRAAFDRARCDARRGVREQETAQADDDRRPLFETPAEGEERRRAIEAALRQLPAAQREVLVLKIWGELTLAEIASRLEISPNTAASRYRYALVALREQLASADCHG